MVASAPRLDRRLLEVLEALERPELSVAAIRRALVRHALAAGIPPPSYEHVRRLVVELRERRRDAGPPIGELAIGVAFRAEPVRALVDALVEDLG